jgi:hypothetical protein
MKKESIKHIIGEANEIRKSMGLMTLSFWLQSLELRLLKFPSAL